MKGLLAYSDDERRATLTGINLFFSALLGANLGAMNTMPLGDYVQMVVILAGAVTAVLTLAVSKRRLIISTTALALALILAAILLVPEVGPDSDKGVMDRLAVTLGVWVAMLLVLRMTPSSDGDRSAPVVDDD